MDRRFLVLLALCLVVPRVLAYTFVPSSVTVEAVVSPDGTATVKERYVLVLDTPQDINNFQTLVNKLGNSFYLWSREIKGLTYHFGTSYTELQDVTLSTRIVSHRLAYVVLSYSLPLAKKEKDTPTYTEWIIVDFHFPWRGDAFHIPAGYTLTIVLPPESTIKEVDPEADIKKNVITWEGPISTTKLLVRYILPKPPRPVSILELLTSFSFSTYVGIGIVIIGILLFVFRRRIARAIESYVVEHSEFSEEE